MSGLMAVEYVHNDPQRFLYILNKCCEHRPWFDDWTWEDEEARRKAVIDYLSEAKRDGKLWEVYNGRELVGILLLNGVRLRMDARCHFVFFDRKLKDKQDICLSTMAWAFKHLEVHRLSIEIPTYAMALVNFARKYLGFRYEAEARQFSWPKNASRLSAKKAELGSRKHQYTYWKRQWHDVLLLSVTRREFDDFVRTIAETRGEDPATDRAGDTLPDAPGQTRGQDDSGPAGVRSGLGGSAGTGTRAPDAGVDAGSDDGPPAVPAVDPADERPPETTDEHVRSDGGADDPGGASPEADVTPWGTHPGL